jgi:tellurite resistance protein TehA-like permease
MLFILKIYIIRKKIKNIVNKLQVSYFINKFNINLLVLLISQFGEKPEKI